MTKFQMGFTTCGIWTPFFIQRNEILSFNSTVDLIIALSIGVAMYLIGCWIADKFCKE